ncbi:hypothetical protein AAF712_016673 [Marasmius tenuissimus]|uniref:Helicase C-terminal domain-containing protein n=1 Tax=Marasmius tenuissimus TaxID=585030 RepID=A0ABR2Z7E7_9AGAR
MDSDPELQVLIATVAFTMGINCRKILDSVSWNFPSSVDDFWQAKRRAGRIEEVVCRGIAIVPPSLMKAVKDLVTGLDGGKPATIVQIVSKGKKKKKKGSNLPMEESKARFLIEETCYIGFLNRHYQNPGSSLLDCQEAERANFCSLCTTRYERDSGISLPTSPSLAWKPSIPSSNKQPSECKSKTKLGKQEKQEQRKWLIDFRSMVRSEFQPQDRYLSNHPISWFLLDHIIDNILHSFLTIMSHAELVQLLNQHSWKYTSSRSEQQYDLLSDFQRSIRQRRKEESKERAARKRTAKESDDDESSDSGMSCDTAELPGRSPSPLTSVNLQPSLHVYQAAQPAPPKPRKPREAQQSVAEYSASFGPQRTKRIR